MVEISMNIAIVATEGRRGGLGLSREGVRWEEDTCSLGDYFIPLYYIRN